jgi:murein DD-endopeptidase MepM/ murein hydrolase activator NlpD
LNLAKRVLKYLKHSVTIMVVPHTDLPVLRKSFTLSSIALFVGVWTLLTVFAGFRICRQVDYWVTRTDNAVVRSKMAYMADEIERTRSMLEMARATDKQIRILLGMGSREDILRGDTGIGGPTALDGLSLKRLLSGEAPQDSQAAVHKTMDQLRQEGERRLASFQEIAWYITHQRCLYRATPNGWPAQGRITSGFGYRLSPIQAIEDANRQFHEGIDIASAPDTPITATADGVVRYAGWYGGYGMIVIVDHGFGFSTSYAHASKVTVAEGDRVTRGQLLAYMGTSGRSTGTHVHYEIWHHGRPVSPIRFLSLRLEDERFTF